MVRSLLLFVVILFLGACSSEKEKLISQIKTAETGLLNDTSLVVNLEKGKAVKEM